MKASFTAAAALFASVTLAQNTTLPFAACLLPCDQIALKAVGCTAEDLLCHCEKAPETFKILVPCVLANSTCGNATADLLSKHITSDCEHLECYTKLSSQALEALLLALACRTTSLLRPSASSSPRTLRFVPTLPAEPHLSRVSTPGSLQMSKLVFGLRLLLSLVLPLLCKDETVSKSS